ncbi:MAG: hypothetical protein MJ172_11140 [Clostridia bacterium]|nr:hypothetical protein [Clostridia bacterium]
MTESFTVKLPRWIIAMFSLILIIPGIVCAAFAIYSYHFLGSFDSLSGLLISAGMIAILIGLIGGLILSRVRLEAECNIVKYKKVFTSGAINLDEVDRIICGEGFNSRGISTGKVITIKAGKKTIKVDQAYMGWDKFTAYLLTKIDRNVLDKKKVITSGDYKSLKSWK